MVLEFEVLLLKLVSVLHASAYASILHRARRASPSNITHIIPTDGRAREASRRWFHAVVCISPCTDVMQGTRADTQSFATLYNIVV